MRARPLVPVVAAFVLVAVSGPVGATAAGGSAGHSAKSGTSRTAGPAAPAVPGAPTIRADFNDDGAEDLAVGSAFEAVGGVGDAGTVHVLFGGGGGLTGTGSQLFNQESAGITSDAEEGDMFGWSLTTGDFDGDGFTDLAVGTRNESVGTVPGAGVVHVLYGSATGLQAVGSRMFTQDSPGIAGQVEAFDNFGVALAAADLDGEGGTDDLAIGVDREDLDGRADAGAVHVLYGQTASGLTGVGSTLLSQSGPAVPSEPEPGDQFGFSLAAADFDGDGIADLAVGAPTESAGTVAGAGAVNVFDGSAGGVTTAGSLIFTQDSPGVGSTAEADDALAAALTAGDFDGDGLADLAVGASNEAVGTVAGAGAVNTLRGSAAGLTGVGGQLFHQDVGDIGSTAEVIDTFGGALASGDFDGDGADDLAIGVPAEGVGTAQMAGALNVLYGGGTGGLSITGTQLFVQGSGGVGDTPELRDELGFAVASSDFDGDGLDDLAVGATFEAVGSVPQAGALHVLPGTGTGLTGVGSQLFTQSSPGIGSDVEPFDAFGFAVGATRSTTS